MRYFIVRAIVLISLVVFGVTNAAEAQNYSKDGKVFKSVKITVASDDIKTAYTWEDSKGNSFPIYLHKVTKGDNAGQYKAYVLKKSAKTGKEYKYFMPKSLEIAKDIINERGH